MTIYLLLRYFITNSWWKSCAKEEKNWIKKEEIFQEKTDVPVMDEVICRPFYLMDRVEALVLDNDKSYLFSVTRHVAIRFSPREKNYLLFLWPTKYLYASVTVEGYKLFFVLLLLKKCELLRTCHSCFNYSAQYF